MQNYIAGGVIIFIFKSIDMSAEVTSENSTSFPGPLTFPSDPRPLPSTHTHTQDSSHVGLLSTPQVVQAYFHFALTIPSSWNGLLKFPSQLEWSLL